MAGLGLACQAERPADSVVRRFDGVPVVITGRIVAPPERHVTPALYLESGRTIGIVGELAEEIRRLSGAQVTILGEPGPDGAIQARTYAVIEINGERPEVGVISRRSMGYVLFLESGELPLASRGAAPLRSLVGSKIWALGQRQGEELHIESYGVIRP
jgi:hypothetical protein